MKNVNDRIAWIDTARGIGLLLVFFGHMSVSYLSSWIYTFHMPFFFFLSGMLYPGCKKYSFSEFAWRRFKGLVIPYFTLGIVIALFYCCLFAYYHRPASAYTDMLRAFLIQKHYWTIWFLTALFLSQILYYCIDKCFHQWKYAVTAASFGLCLYGFARYRLGWDALPWNLDVAFIAQFFFHLGYRFMHNPRVRDFFVGSITATKRIGILVICFLVNGIASKACIMVSGDSLDMSIGMYGNEALTLIAALAGILMIMTISSVIHSRFITYLGQNTMILFSWHSRIIIVACGMVFAHYGLFQSGSMIVDVERAVVTLIIILIVLIPVNEFVKRLPCHKAFGV